jgi:hypothetical protein
MPRLSHQRKVQIARLAWSWCAARWSKSPVQAELPKLRCLARSARHEYYGWYRQEINLITLNLGNCSRAEDIIRTLVHEWCHWGQDCSDQNWDRLEARARRRDRYWDHPLERAARRREDRYWAECWSAVRRMYL